MPNSGFRGDRVLIEKLSVAPGPSGAPVLTCHVQFAAEDGTVHAVAQHSFLLDAEADERGFTPLVSDLVDAVTKHVESIHFSEPQAAERSVLRGIAETLRGEMSTSKDEPGPQG